MKNDAKCQNELKQDIGFRDDHPLVLCIRCLRFTVRARFGMSIYDKGLKICSKCCNEEKGHLDKDWIEDLYKMRAKEIKDALVGVSEQ